MINYTEICRLIYEIKTKDSCTMALALLSEPVIGIEEAIRCLYLKDAYFRLGQKEKVMEYGRLANKCAEDFFSDKKILNTTNLYNQCMAIQANLKKIGKCDIKIDTYIKKTQDVFGVRLDNSEIYQEVLTSDLRQEIKRKICYRQRDERFWYYKALSREISNNIKEIVASDLYDRIILHINRTV